MTSHQRLCSLVATGTLVAALAGCGPAPNSASASGESPNATAAAPAAASGGVTAAALPPMPDPDHDSRPDRVKFDDFAAHLERQQSDLAAADADFLPAARAAMQSGAQSNAKLVLAGYRSQIGADIAALPAPPRLSGCFARAQSLDATAEARLAAMLSDRRDKADAVAAVTDRPLTLPDFGGLATDIATRAGADDARASLASARAAVAGCHEAPVAQVHRQAAGSTEAPTSAPEAPAVAPAQAAPRATGASPPPSAPPSRKPGFFQRLFGGG